MARRLPSVKTIQSSLADCKDDAHKIRRIMEDCLHRPLTLLQRVNKFLGAHGVEYIADRRDDQHDVYGIEYINMGDSYIPTLCYDRDKDRIFISSWGDIVEKYPRRFGME
jgi:hypothetical protein